MHSDTLGRAADIVMGQSPPGEVVAPQPIGLPLLNGPTEFGPHHPTPVQFTKDARKKAIAGDILFCVRGSTTGRMNWADREYAIGRGIAAIRHKEDQRVQPFVRAVIEYALPGLLAQATGSTFPNVSATQLAAIPYPGIEIDEQRAIAAVLGALDDKIEQNRRTALALERLARAIFRAWFVDFEPVKAKAAGAASFPSMPQHVFDALPTRYVDSDLGPIPEGWKVKALVSLATLSKLQVKPQDNPEEAFDHFSIPAFDAGMRPVVEFGRSIKSNKLLVAEGSVLLSKLNPRIFRVWLPHPPRGRRQIASTEFLVFVPRDALDRHYVYCQFLQADFRDELAQGASGTSNSHQRVRPDDLLDKPVIVPPSAIRNAFTSIVDPLFALAVAIHIESAGLAEMRDYLLPKLLTGDVQVSVDSADPKESA